MRRTLGLACVCVSLLAGECTQSESPVARLPEGTTLLTKTAALKRSLERIMEIEQTPLARWARGVHQSLPACPLITGHAPSGRLVDLWPTLACNSAATGLEVSLGKHDMAFASVRDAASENIVGLVDVAADGDISLDLSIPQSFSDGGFGLLLPGSKPPGTSLLSGRDTLLHTRIRPSAGLNLASLIAADSQGAQMFRLDTELFAGVVLEGSWELAIYMPDEGSRMPRMAIALGFEFRSAAIAAMDSFIEKLEQTWPVVRSPFRVGEAEGACLLGLRLLPELAPCYVASDAALVIGWNPTSLRKSLGDPTDSFAELGDLGGVTIDLARFVQADEILSRALAAPTGSFSGGFPWRRLVATGRPNDSGFQLFVRLQTGPQS